MIDTGPSGKTALLTGASPGMVFAVTIVFLANPKAPHITSQALTVDGGHVEGLL